MAISYSGCLVFKDITFFFSFDGKQLKLISQKEDARKIDSLLFIEIYPGVYSGSKNEHIEGYLKGFCNESGGTIVFFPSDSCLGNVNGVLLVDITAYIVLKYEREFFDKVAFVSKAINFVHPVNEAFTFSFETENCPPQKGVVSISTKEFDATNTEKREFRVDGKKANVYFSVNRRLQTNNGEPPLSLNSTMIFEFDKTDDFNFIFRLWRVAELFVQYLCYRKNIYLDEVEISAPYSGGKHESFGTMYIVNRKQRYPEENELFDKKRYIRQSYIDSCEGRILTDIADGMLYSRHLPLTYSLGKTIDASRFVMITAAFEWEFNCLFEGKIEKREHTVLAESAVNEQITELINRASGKKYEKKILLFLQKCIGLNSMQSEIIHMGKQFDSIVGTLGRRLYALNNETLKYSEMGERISKQRNNFAHGNLDQEFIGVALLDLVFLEYIVYAMQLKRYGVEDIVITRIINDLFGCGFAI